MLLGGGLRSPSAFLVIIIIIVTLPPLERYLNWVPGITPPPSRDHGQKDIPPPPRDHGKNDSPSPSRDHGKENLPPHKLPRKIRPHRRREKHHIPGSSQNESQPGTSGSLTFQRPQHPQPPSPAANHNSSRSYLQDHSESRPVYNPAQPSIQQDSSTRSRQDSFSGSGLSSPALQRSHRDSFSGSPSGQTHKNVSLTDPLREARIAGGWRPGTVQSHPCAAHPDVRLDIDAALPEAAAVSHAERPPVVLEIPESERLETRSPSRIAPQTRIEVAQAPSPQTAQEPLFSAIPAKEAPCPCTTLV